MKACLNFLIYFLFGNGQDVLDLQQTYFRIGYSIPMFCGFIIMFVSTVSKYILINNV